MKTVKADSTLLLHFRLSLEDGTEVESNYDQQPIEFSIGDGSLTSGMEDVLMGKHIGDTVDVTLSPELGFGMPDGNNIHSMPIADFPDDMLPEVNQVIAFDGPDDSEIMGTIVAINNDEVDVDFSHPLAGRVIRFSATIKDILSS